MRNKRVIKKINLYFFEIMKNDHMFLSEVCHFQYIRRFFLVEKWRTLSVQGGTSAKTY